MRVLVFQTLSIGMISGIVAFLTLDATAQISTPTPTSGKQVVSTPGKAGGRGRNSVRAPRKRSGEFATPVSGSEKRPTWARPKEILAVGGKAAVSEDEARELLERARSLVLQGREGEALPLLREAAKLEPRSHEIQMLLGATLFMLDMPEDAVSAFRKAVVLSSDNAQTHSALCMALEATGRWVESVDSCRSAVRLDPKSDRFRAQLAQLYLRDDRVGEAMQLIQAVNAEQDDLLVLGPLGDTYYALGEYAKAAALYERVAAKWPAISLTYLRLSGVYDYLDRPTDMIKAARKFVELEPALALSHFNLGLSLQATGFFDESVAPLERAIELDREDGEAYLALAETYETVGDTENMLKALKLAYKILPPDPALAFRFGMSVWNAGRWADAVEPLEWANSALPNNAQIMRSLGMVYIDVHRYDEGLDLLDRAARISPPPPNMKIDFSYVKERHALLARFDEIIARVKSHPEDILARRELAAAYEYKGMAKEKEEQLIAIARIEPTYQNYNRLGIFYSRHGQTEKELGAQLKALELNPHHVLYMVVSETLLRLGRIDEALAAGKRSVEIKPTLLESRLSLAEVWLKKGNRQEALRELQAGYEIAPMDPRPNFKLAWLYVRMGNRDGAFRHYSILKGIAPHDIRKLELALTAHFGRLP